MRKRSLLNKLMYAILSIIIILTIFDYFGFHILPPLFYSLFPILPAVRLLSVRESIHERIARRASELAILIFPLVAAVVSLLLIISGDPVIEGYVYGMFTILVLMSIAALGFNDPRFQRPSREVMRDIIIPYSIGLFAAIIPLYLSGGYKYPSTLCLASPTCSFLVILGSLIFIPHIYFDIAYIIHYLKGPRTN